MSNDEDQTYITALMAAARVLYKCPACQGKSGIPGFDRARKRLLDFGWVDVVFVVVLGDVSHPFTGEALILAVVKHDFAHLWVGRSVDLSF